jgi:hypothetical protein
VDVRLLKAIRFKRENVSAPLHASEEEFGRIMRGGFFNQGAACVAKANRNMFYALIIPFRKHHAADRYRIACELRHSVPRHFPGGDQREKTETNLDAKPAHGVPYFLAGGLDYITSTEGKDSVVYNPSSTMAWT